MLTYLCFLLTINNTLTCITYAYKYNRLFSTSDVNRLRNSLLIFTQVVKELCINFNLCIEIISFKFS